MDSYPEQAAVVGRYPSHVHSANENVRPDVAFDRIETRGGPVGTEASKRRSG
jgi:hypothetical protein